MEHDPIKLALNLANSTLKKKKRKHFDEGGPMYAPGQNPRDISPEEYRDAVQRRAQTDAFNDYSARGRGAMSDAEQLKMLENYTPMKHPSAGAGRGFVNPTLRKHGGRAKK